MVAKLILIECYLYHEYHCVCVGLICYVIIRSLTTDMSDPPHSLA